VFTIRHRAEEGGLNLNMEAAAIQRMAESGALAAQAIAEQFQAPDGTAPADDDWHQHRWVRLRLLLPVLRAFARQLGARARAPGPVPTVRDLLTLDPRPMGRSHELNIASRAAAEAFVQALAAASEALEGAKPDLERTQPRPPGQLRVTPTF
jgi:hypothetical protein